MFHCHNLRFMDTEIFFLFMYNCCAAVEFFYPAWQLQGPKENSTFFFNACSLLECVPPIVFLLPNALYSTRDWRILHCTGFAAPELNVPSCRSRGRFQLSLSLEHRIEGRVLHSCVKLTPDSLIDDVPDLDSTKVAEIALDREKQNSRCPSRRCYPLPGEMQSKINLNVIFFLVYFKSLQ